ncbi:MAG: hypothetical protein QOG20_3054 [Pseudonocardiales bacterium]|nr:hypothetical protein [Pseudonocardiales bacterium]
MTQPASRTPSPNRTPARQRSRGGDRVRSGTGGRWPMPDRSLIATVLGVPPLAAIGIAAVLTAAGVLFDLARAGTLGVVFTICYVVGCVLAVVWVRRSGLFGPMVQPPLLLAVAVPVVVLVAGSQKPGAGVAERLLVIGAPLVNSFPTMAWVTGIVVAIGAFRLVVQRPLDGEPAPRVSKADAARARAAERAAVSRPAPARGPRPSERDAARGAARTSRSPRRS